MSTTKLHLAGTKHQEKVDEKFWIDESHQLINKKQEFKTSDGELGFEALEEESEFESERQGSVGKISLCIIY